MAPPFFLERQGAEERKVLKNTDQGILPPQSSLRNVFQGKISIWHGL
jgi:hypothetical protein